MSPKSTNEKVNTAGRVLLLIVCIGILIPLFLLAPYDRPGADDYDFSIFTHEAVSNGDSLLAAALHNSTYFYKCWQGTYSASFVLALQPGIWGEKYYGVTVPIVFFISFLCLYGAFSILNSIYVGKGRFDVFLTSFAATTVLFLWLPSITEGLYWYNGAMTYIPWVFLLVLEVALSVKLENISESGKIGLLRMMLLCTISFFLPLIIAGGNQTVSFEQILVFATVTVICIVKKKRPLCLINLSGAIFGFMITYFSPGTTIRQANLERAGVIETVLATLGEIRELAGTWISIVWVILILMAVPICIIIAIRAREKMPAKFPWWIILIFGMVISGMLCVPYMASGTFGAQRLFNVVWITFILFSWLSELLIVGWIVRKLDVKTEVRHTWIAVSLALCLLAVVTQYGRESNTLRAFHDFRSGRAETYAAQMDERYEAINAALDVKNADFVVEFEPLSDYSTILFVSEFGYEPGQWPNYSVGQYYGVGVKLK